MRLPHLHFRRGNAPFGSSEVKLKTIPRHASLARTNEEQRRQHQGAPRDELTAVTVNRAHECTNFTWFSQGGKVLFRASAFQARLRPEEVALGAASIFA